MRLLHRVLCRLGWHSWQSDDLYHGVMVRHCEWCEESQELSAASRYRWVRNRFLQKLQLPEQD